MRQNKTTKIFMKKKDHGCLGSIVRDQLIERYLQYCDQAIQIRDQ